MRLNGFHNYSKAFPGIPPVVTNTFLHFKIESRNVRVVWQFRDHKSAPWFSRYKESVSKKGRDLFKCPQWLWPWSIFHSTFDFVLFLLPRDPPNNVGLPKNSGYDNSIKTRDFCLLSISSLLFLVTFPRKSWVLFWHFRMLQAALSEWSWIYQFY